MLRALRVRNSWIHEASVQSVMGLVIWLMMIALVQPGWSPALLIFVVLLFIALALRVTERWLAAGIFAFVAVIAWGLFVGSAWAWFGWLHHWNSPFQGWSLAHLSLEFLILVAALVGRWIWRFPFIASISAVFAWFFVTDFISNGGWWTYAAPRRTNGIGMTPELPTGRAVAWNAAFVADSRSPFSSIVGYFFRA